VKKNITLLYGFSFFDQFMIVIALWVPYLATQGIGMRQFMELQAVFALVILCGEMPSGLLSDLWGRKKTLLLGSTLKAVSFSLLPLWSSYEGFLVYHLTMGIALSMISGGDVALLYDSYLAAGGEKSSGTAVLGNAKLAAQTGTTVSALVGGAVLGWGGILLGILAPVGRGLGEVLFLEALNERISSAFRATVISMANLGIRASFCLLGPLVGYGIDGCGLPSVLSALGILFSIAFVVLLLPLVLSPAERLRA
jgi:MFS family permease